MSSVETEPLPQQRLCQSFNVFCAVKFNFKYYKDDQRPSSKAFTSCLRKVICSDFVRNVSISIDVWKWLLETRVAVTSRTDSHLRLGSQQLFRSVDTYTHVLPWWKVFTKKSLVSTSVNTISKESRLKLFRNIDKYIILKKYGLFLIFKLNSIIVFVFLHIINSVVIWYKFVFLSSVS